ncbi:ABC transporter ATP-binding protein [bacterium]|nr:ABC transporter ATP-binding protein [bacterium]
MPILKLIDIHKSHNGDPTLKGINLDLESGEILCLLGPSGCGKTTLLRIIAGLEQPDSGRVLFNGKDIGRVQTHLRNFSMMFQEFALFPHKNVFDNVAFGLQIKKQETASIAKRTREILSLVGLEGMEQRNTSELSGGERQRVALARSLAPQPRLLMLDEPMGSLDRALRERLIRDLRKILKKVKVTAIFVTHDQNEAFAVADRIAVFNNGLIEQIAPADVLYKKPASSFVANFLGFQNLLEGTVLKTGLIKTGIGELPIAEHRLNEGDSTIVLILPEAARLIDKNTKTAENEISIKGQVEEQYYQGANYQLTIKIANDIRLTFNLPLDNPIPLSNQEIQLALKISAITLIPDN